MAERSDLCVALLSIKPRYAHAILAGTKLVELRRSCLPERLSHVVIYSSSPERRIVGWFDVARVDRGSPTAIWNRYRDMTGVTRSEFRSYFAGSPEAFAVVIRRVHVLERPMLLTDVVVDGVAPQSFRYLDGREASTVIPGLRLPVLA